ncbi:MAG: aspartate kinase [Bacteroidales bacterium]|nr:aspartate kinase [Bacteroidales bacterium]
MKPISKTVEELIIKQPFIIELMRDGLINLSSLARKMVPEIAEIRQTEVTQASVMMALKRLSENLNSTKSQLINVRKTKFNDITVRTNLTDYTFENSPTLINCQQKLLKYIAGRPEIFVSTSRGIYESTVLITSNLEKTLEEIYTDEKKLSKAENLAAITVSLPSESTSIIGLYYMIFRDISWEGINIYEVISTTNEITLFVKENNVNKAFKILNT